VTFDEWKHAVAIAATLWRGRDAPLDPAQISEWYRVEFHRHAAADTEAACQALARIQDFFPSLAELRQATREVAQDRRNAEERAARGKVLRLRRPPDRTLDERLRLFDGVCAQCRHELEQELHQLARQYPLDGETLRRRLDQLDELGPFTRRARELTAGRATLGAGIDEMLRGFSGGGSSSTSSADPHRGQDNAPPAASA
jgi:hypothetical protein